MLAWIPSSRVATGIPVTGIATPVIVRVVKFDFITLIEAVDQKHVGQLAR